MANITASELKTRVEFVRETGADDGFGGETNADTVIANAWGAVRPMSASEQSRAQRLEQRASHYIFIRWNPTFLDLIRQGDRARFRDRANRTRELYISTVRDPDEGATWLEIACEEGGPRRDG